jgi:hypothetical protein
MNLGINKDEAIILQFALEDWLTENKDTSWKQIFTNADIDSIFKQLQIIIMCED